MLKLKKRVFCFSFLFYISALLFFDLKVGGDDFLGFEVSGFVSPLKPLNHHDPGDTFKSSVPGILVVFPSLKILSDREIVIDGGVDIEVELERSIHLDGPWQTVTNININTQGKTVQVTPIGADSVFYRLKKAESVPSGFVWIKPGEFLMGSPVQEEERQTSEIQHSVLISKGFWMCDHEVTQQEFQNVMSYNPSFQPISPIHPVEGVDWEAAAKYCYRLTQIDRARGIIQETQEYRLPTEAEWEYAARAGSTEPRYGEIDMIAWWRDNSNNQTQPIKGKQPNAWGLYDMIGNVSEWCGDWIRSYSNTSMVDPTGDTFGTSRVIRGGSYYENSIACRSAARNWERPVRQARNLGFRVVLAAVR
jgi:formylglycine-generating enzyme required for sulfatase activity